jgi:hypothetical protein
MFIAPPSWLEGQVLKLVREQWKNIAKLEEGVEEIFHF